MTDPLLQELLGELRAKFAAPEFDPPFIKHGVYVADIESFLTSAILRTREKVMEEAQENVSNRLEPNAWEYINAIKNAQKLGIGPFDAGFEYACKTFRAATLAALETLKQKKDI